MNIPTKRGSAGEDGPRARKRQKRKSKKESEDHLNWENSLNLSIGLMDSQLLSDYFTRMTARSGSHLSSVELSDLALPARYFRDTTKWQGRRTLAEMPLFIESFTQDIEQLRMPSSTRGAPHTLIVAGAAMRAADIVRTMRNVSGEGNHVAKLFAKHIKVEEQARHLRKSHIGIAVGTPARLLQLIGNEALSISHLRMVVVDSSYIDAKGMGIMEIKPTMLALAKLLTAPALRARFDQDDDEKPLSLLFY